MREEVELKLNSRKKLNDLLHQLKFSINGSYLYSLQIHTKPGVSLVNWDISDKVPEPNSWNGQKGYFVMVTHGLEAPPLNFTLSLEVN